MRGRVVRPDGSPIAGATVSLGKSLETTDDAGWFSMPRGSGTLRVTHADFFPREIEATGVGAVSLVLVPGVRIRGTVVGPDGAPVAQARLQFGTSELPPETFSGARGDYESPLLTPSPVCVLASHVSFQPQSRVLHPQLSGPPSRWDVRLVPGEPLRVVVHGLDEASRADAEVWLDGAAPLDAVPSKDAAAPSEWRFLGRTDDLGRLSTRKPPGAATLRVRLPGHRDEAVAVAEGGSETLVRLRPAPALRGQAIDGPSGLPVRIRALSLEILERGEYVEASHRGVLHQSLEPGKFVVGLPPNPGTYRLRVRASADATDAPMELEAESLAIEFDGLSSPPDAILRAEERLVLRGSIELPSSGAGPAAGGSVSKAGISVELLADAPPEALLDDLDDGPQRFLSVSGVLVPAPFRPVAEAWSDEQGKFIFQTLSHGTYRLRVDPSRRRGGDDAAAGWAEYLSAPFALPWEGDFPILLRRAAMLSGTLRDERGRPEPGTPVVLIRGEDWSRVERTDGDGRYSFSGLGPSDRYRLVVGSESGSAPEARGESRSLTLEEGKDLVYDLRRWSAESRQVEEATVSRSAPIPPTETAASSAPTTAPSPAPETDPPPDASNSRPEPAVTAADLAEPVVTGFEEPAEDLRADEEARGEPPASADLRVELVDAVTGKPLSAAVDVDLTSSDGTASWEGAARKAGFEAHDLPGGRYRLRLRSKGLLLLDRELDVAGTTRTRLAMDEPHDVRVNLVTSTGEPFREAADLTLRKDGVELYRSRADIDSEVIVPTPGPGEYELQVEGEHHRAVLKVTVTREPW